jgi:FixJ family two-component response regulator
VSKEPLIAVVDDDESFRAALVELLSSTGYAVRGFASAEELVGVGGAGLFGCIITDIHLPGMSGIDLKQLLMSGGYRVPVIMITARADPGLEGRAVSSGAVCLLRKPFEADALIGWLDKALEV